ncbi:MAG: Transcriptional activator protein CopR [Pseudomonadota bacterium]|jgi:two-component system cell cycle response regulator
MPTPGTRSDRPESQSAHDEAAASPPAGADDRPEIRVAAFGLAGKFQRILEIVFRHARHNPYQFVLSASRGPGDYDVALVDMTAKGGPDVAQTLRRLPEARPIVTVGRREDPTRAQDDLVLQRFAMNLLTVLNQVVERKVLRAARAGASLARSALAWLGDLDAERLLGRKARALLIDESPAVRRQLSLALHQMGLDCEGVGSGREALDVMAVRRYELVFLEAELPDMSGLRLARDIKRDPALRGMPVIVLTRRSGPLDLVRGALSRCDSYLVKPVTLQTLRETVARCLRRSLAAVAARGEGRGRAPAAA